MAERSRRPHIDDPGKKKRRFRIPTLGHRTKDGDSFGRFAEGIARFMGTPQFLLWMTIFCAVWLGWNTFMPKSAQFDPRALNFTLLTLILSLQASYAAPLLLLAQNRQDDRDRVQAEADRQSNELAHATTDFITREIASLRLAVNDVATRDYVRGEIRDLLEELREPIKEEADGNEANESPQPSASASGHPAPGEVSLREILRAELRTDLRDIVREEFARARLVRGEEQGAGTRGVETPPEDHTQGEGKDL